MSSSKKLKMNLSDTQNEEFNKALKEDCKKRSEFIREAVILYIEQKKKLSFIDEMKKGYLDMSQINLEISEMGLASDICEFKEYEARLSESDFPDDYCSKKRRYILC